MQRGHSSLRPWYSSSLYFGKGTVWLAADGGDLSMNMTSIITDVELELGPRMRSVVELCRSRGAISETG